MPIGIRTTKLFHSTPTGSWVERHHLLHQLTQSLDRDFALTLVSAPAGYGKSTLVSSWLANLDRPAAWLSLEEMDDDPGRFMLYFIAAIQRIEPAFCTELFAALQAGQTPPADVLVTLLVNEMSLWAEQRILVLDDFHYIQNSLILELFSNLLVHQPRSLHLMILTREDPALPLARLRARGQLNEIRAADLRFSVHESIHFLREIIGLKLTDKDIQHLTERTEGWAAGLQLVGLSLQGSQNSDALIRSLTGSHRFILGYLTEEVLKRQPADVQEFLLQTSILAQLTGTLCDAVTGGCHSEARLEALFSANLFLVPLDEEGRWYRYHHLFAELLQTQLRRLQPNLLPELHQRASRWYESQDMPASSIEHALVAGDHRHVVVLLEKYGWRLLTQGHSRMFMKWVQSLPEPLRNGSPKLNTGIVWGKILHGDYQQAGPYLVAAQSSLENLPPESAPALALQADILALQSFMAQAQGDAAEAMALAEKARSLASNDDLRLAASTALAFGVACRMTGRFEQAIEALEYAMHSAQAIDDYVTSMVAVAHLSLLWYPLGRLRRLAETAEIAIERAETISQVAPVMIGSVHAVLGLVYYEWNQVEKARESLLHGIRLARLSEQPASLIFANVHLARLSQGEGELEAAAVYLHEAGKILQQGGPGWARLDWVAAQISLLVAQNKLDEAETMLAATGIPAEAQVTYQTDVIHLAWLRWMLSSRHPGAFVLAERIVQSAEAEGRNGTLIQALVLGAKAGCAEWLARARQLGGPEGYQRVFMNDGLDEKAVTSLELIEQLSEREVEVLQLLAEGLTYAEIAGRLVVSINTVRYHVKKLYGKLGVEKQTQAVERGRALRLV